MVDKTESLGQRAEEFGLYSAGGREQHDQLFHLLDKQ